MRPVERLQNRLDLVPLRVVPDRYSAPFFQFTKVAPQPFFPGHRLFQAGALLPDPRHDPGTNIRSTGVQIIMPIRSSAAQGDEGARISRQIRQNDFRCSSVLQLLEDSVDKFLPPVGGAQEITIVRSACGKKNQAASLVIGQRDHANQRFIFIGQKYQRPQLIPVGSLDGKRPFVGVEDFRMLHAYGQFIPRASQFRVFPNLLFHHYPQVFTDPANLNLLNP